VKIPHGLKWKKGWSKPDLTPPEGKSLVITEWGWAVQHPENLELGFGVDIGYGTYINARIGVTIGDDVEIGGGCHIYSYNSIDEIGGSITLEEGCKIGAHCVILPGVTIGEGAVVGAMSLVKNNVAAGSTVAGVPAQNLRSKIIPLGEPMGRDSSVCTHSAQCMEIMKTTINKEIQFRCPLLVVVDDDVEFGGDQHESCTLKQ